MRAERLWQGALELSEAARASGDLVPLRTELVDDPRLHPFVLRRLLSRTPKHLRGGGPRPNPFLPWEPALELERLGRSHVVLLNKFPVQPAHLLLITQDWQPQTGWITAADWSAVAHLARDTGGFWFFNSCAAAGASQPHRHLQLLPRRADEPSCPLAAHFLREIAGNAPGWPWRYAIAARRSADDPLELEQLYLRQARDLELGDPRSDSRPHHPYNLLFDDDWFITVRREQEHCAGYSVNALGFGGYLLATDRSDSGWLERHGPWELLRRVAAPR
ncbi:DUF4922 domain-containing protein [Cyanobium sp. NIES-981]|uniref:DUF4922 domain-containing protein n=1 Tax=Cyanobium sp. NIES-981 TaxID=1851505 RepID=UPI0007DCEF7F|nr:DUF4922 domain-containing protein [Cyanobium sp. NIES-981]SBO42284.1 ATP adenylyltransferase [Cyanobium sp. NIES-981]